MIINYNPSRRIIVAKKAGKKKVLSRKHLVRVFWCLPVLTELRSNPFTPPLRHLASIQGSSRAHARVRLPSPGGRGTCLVSLNRKGTGEESDLKRSTWVESGPFTKFFNPPASPNKATASDYFLNNGAEPEISFIPNSKQACCPRQMGTGAEFRKRKGRKPSLVGLPARDPQSPGSAPQRVFCPSTGTPPLQNRGFHRVTKVRPENTKVGFTSVGAFQTDSPKQKLPFAFTPSTVMRGAVPPQGPGLLPCLCVNMAGSFPGVSDELLQENTRSIFSA